MIRSHIADPVVLAAVLMFALVCQPAAAMPQSVPTHATVQWTAPRGCPAQPDVVARIEQLLGHTLASDGSGTVAEVRGTVSRTGRRWRARLSISHAGRARQRVIQGDTCVDVTDAAALVLALAIDPTAVARVNHSASAPAAPPALASAPSSPAAPIATVASDPPRSSASESTTPEVAAAVVPPPAPVTPEPTHAPSADSPPADVAPSTPSRPRPVRARRTLGSLRLAARGDLGSLPHLAPGLALVAGFEIAWLRVQVGGAAWLPQRNVVGMTDSAQGGDVGLYTGLLGVCAVGRPRALDVGACVGIDLGWQTGTGFGVSEPGTAGSIWVAPTVDLFLRRHVVGPLAITAELGVAVPLVRPTFVLDGVGTVHQPWFVSGRGALGLELDF